MGSITVDESIHEEDRSDDEDESKDVENEVCQLLNLKGGILV